MKTSTLTKIIAASLFIGRVTLSEINNRENNIVPGRSIENNMNMYKSIHPRIKTELPVGTIVHPGDILLEQLQTKGLKKIVFARKLKMSNSQFSDLIHGRRGLTESLASKLEELLDIPAKDWLALQASHDFCNRDIV